MTLEQKVGQLFLVRPDSLDLSQTQDQINDAKADGVTELTDAMRQTLAEYPVGGVVIFGKNLESPQQITQFLDDLQQASDTPLFTAIDEEGGLVARLANNAAFDLPQYESAAAVGTSGNPEDARAMGRTIGGYLKEYGFNLDFAPVADVNTNPITRSSVPARSAVNRRPPPTLWRGVRRVCRCGHCLHPQAFPRPWRYQRGYPRWHRNAEQNAG